MYNLHQITISLPDWFCAILSFSMVAVVFYLGTLYAKFNGVCKDHINMQRMLDSMQRTLDKMSDALVRISEILIQNKLTANLIYARSPIRLTEEGERVIREAGFENFYLNNKPRIIEVIQQSSLKSLADLDEACKKFMLNLGDDFPDFESIKQYAFNRGEPISKILFVYAIALRDRLSEDLNIRNVATLLRDDKK